MATSRSRELPVHPVNGNAKRLQSLLQRASNGPAVNALAPQTQAFGNESRLGPPSYQHWRICVRPGGERTLCQKAVVVLVLSSDFFANPARQFDVLLFVPQFDF